MLVISHFDNIPMFLFCISAQKELGFLSVSQMVKTYISNFRRQKYIKVKSIMIYGRRAYISKGLFIPFLSCLERVLRNI